MRLFGVEPDEVIEEFVVEEVDVGEEQVFKRTEAHRFVVLPKRWIVERTFAWSGWSRRLSKDYELRPDSAETTICIAFAHQLLRRIK